MAPRTDHTHVILLRGINVGGKNRVPKDTLIRLAQAGGAQEVTTYLTSGNLLFTLPDVVEATALRSAVVEGIRSELDLAVPSHLVTRDELDEALTLLDELGFTHEDPKMIHLTVLDSTPDPDGAAALESYDGGPDQWAVRRRFVWTRFATSSQKSALTLSRVEKTLKRSGTARNLNTVRALAGRE